MKPLLRRLIVAVVTTVAVLLGTAGTAHASTWLVRDDLELFGSQWDLDGYGFLTCNFYYSCTDAYVSDNGAQARTGTHSVRMFTEYNPDAWVSLGRPFETPVGARSCVATMYVRAELYDGIDTVMQLEVLQAAGWTYLAKGSSRLHDPYNSTWRQIRTASWAPAADRNVYIRMVLTGGEHLSIVNADDLAVSCTVLP
ncbi:hypothetical protein [Dactylosporangium sp. NPDC051541]|uniref:hypothetical protein n=1 Tax=Dactylosporangium sp. NPDC051541 TaxID=3363977 RepID=UPI00378A7844